MPRLQILHHKSYHPYNEKNKQRVREDEAKARAEELAREQRTIDADAQDRLNELRRRAGSPEAGLPTRRDPVERAREDSKQRTKERRQRDRLDFDFPSETKKRNDRREAREREAGPERPPRPEGDGEPALEDGRSLEDRFHTGGHVNFWADEENGQATPAAPPTAAELAKRKAEREADQLTNYLTRPQPKAWYADPELKRVDHAEAGEDAEYRRARDRRSDVRAKDRNDPLTDIHKSLAAKPSRAARPPPRGGSGSGQSERERALALLAKKSGASTGRSWGSSEANSWHDELERQKDTAGNRYHADAWERSRSGRR